MPKDNTSLFKLCEFLRANTEPEHKASETPRVAGDISLDMDKKRLLSGSEDCFNVPITETATAFKKTLILTDWWLKFLSNIDDYQRIIQQLLEDGFDIYARVVNDCNEIEYIKLDTSILSYQYIHKIVPATQKEILEEVTGGAIPNSTADNTFILDHFALKRILRIKEGNIDNEGFLELDFDEYLKLPKEQRDFLLNSIGQQKLVITLKRDYLLRDEIVELRKMAKNIYGLRSTCDKGIIDIFNAIPELLAQIQIFDCPFTSREFSSQASSILNIILQQGNISELTILSENYGLLSKHKPLTTLKALTIDPKYNHGDISLNQLEELPLICPNLAQLKIQCELKDSQECEISPTLKRFLKQLSVIDLSKLDSSTFYSPDTLLVRKLLNSFDGSTNLLQLDIPHIFISEITNVELHLPNLQELSCEGIATDWLKKLLARSKNLTVLKSDFLFLESNETEINDQEASSLMVVKSGAHCAYMSQIYSFTLILQNLRYLYDVMSLPPCKIPKLKTLWSDFLYAKEGDLYFPELETLIARGPEDWLIELILKCPKLKKIDIYLKECNFKEKSPEEIKLSYIHILNAIVSAKLPLRQFFGIRVADANFLICLKDIPTLDVVSIDKIDSTSFCEHKNSDVRLPIRQLFIGSPIDLPCLEWIVSISPNLAEVHVNNTISPQAIELREKYPNIKFYFGNCTPCQQPNLNPPAAPDPPGIELSDLTAPYKKIAKITSFSPSRIKEFKLIILFPGDEVIKADFYRTGVAYPTEDENGDIKFVECKEEDFEEETGSFPEPPPGFLQKTSEPIPLRANEWTKLISGSPSDVLTNIICVNKDGQPVKFHRFPNKKSNLYGIVADEDCFFKITLAYDKQDLAQTKPDLSLYNIDFIFELTKIFQQNDNFQSFKSALLKLQDRLKLDSKTIINTLMRYFIKQGDKEVVDITNSPSNYASLKQYFEKGGSCRDRAKVFAMITYALGLQSRAASNGAHQFPEVKQENGRYKSYQAGGASNCKITKLYLHDGIPCQQPNLNPPAAPDPPGIELSDLTTPYKKIAEITSFSPTEITELKLITFFRGEKVKRTDFYRTGVAYATEDENGDIQFVERKEEDFEEETGPFPEPPPGFLQKTSEPIPLRANEWTKLISGSPSDVLTNIICVNKDGQPVKFHRFPNKKSNLYGIVADEDCFFKITLAYDKQDLAQTEPDPSLYNADFSSALKKIFERNNDFRSFKKELRELKERLKLDNKTIINTLMKDIAIVTDKAPVDVTDSASNYASLKKYFEKGGSCSDRAKVFAMITYALGLQSRVAANGAHQFPEVKQENGRYKSYQTGGASSYKITMLPSPELPKPQVQTEATSSSTIKSIASLVLGTLLSPLLLPILPVLSLLSLLSIFTKTSTQTKAQKPKADVAEKESSHEGAQSHDPNSQENPIAASSTQPYSQPIFSVVPAATEEELDSRFVTWNNKVNVINAKTLDEYFAQVTPSPGESTAIIGDNIDALNSAFMQHLSNDSGFEFYYLDDFSELEKLKDIKIENHRVTKDIPGELGNFLREDHGKRKILLINLQKSSPDDIASMQSIRSLGTVKALKNLSTVFYMTKAQHATMGNDFTSRVGFDHFYEAPTAFPLTPFDIFAKTGETDSSQKDMLEIDWSSETDFSSLIYQISIKERGPEIEVGKLFGPQFVIPEQTVSEQIIPIHIASEHIAIVNPPETDAFKKFYERLCRTHEVFYNGAFYKLENLKSIQCIKREFDFSHYPFEVRPDSIPDNEKHYILNPATIHLFHKNFKVGETAKLETTGKTQGQPIGIPPILKRHAQHHKKQPIKILVTSELPLGKWNMFFRCCDKYNVRPILHFAPNVPIPLEFHIQSWDLKIASEANITPIFQIKQATSALILSANHAITALEMCKEYNDSKVEKITITSSTTSPMLLLNSKLISATSTTNMQLKVKIGRALKLLLEGKTVILVVEGELNPLLRHQLEPLLCSKPYIWENGARKELPGQLFVVMNKKNVIQPKAANIFTVDTNPAEVKVPEKTVFHLTCNDEVKTATFTQMLKDPANRIFSVAGEPGTGESYFITHELQKRNPDLRIYSMDNIKKWAEDKKSGMKVLLYDKAAEHVSSEIFVNLFDTTPGIFINNKFYPLDPSHKVIISINNPIEKLTTENVDTVSLPEILQKHLVPAAFDSMPHNFIETEIIQPLLQRLKLPNVVCGVSIASQITAYFESLKICGMQIPYAEHNATSIVLRLWYMQVKGNITLNANNINLACYLETVGKLTDKDQIKLKKFLLEQGFDPEAAKPSLFARKIPTRYETTKHHHVKFSFVSELNPAFYEISSLLAVRELRRNDTIAFNEGKRAVVIQGVSGIGKTEGAKYLLKQRGFVDCTDDLTLKPGDPDPRHEKKTKARAEGKIFYQITASRDDKTIEAILKRAFNEGAIVIVDEINILHNVERIMKAMLKGEGEYENEASRRGFAIIATQNPPSYRGRHLLPPEILDLFVKVKLEDIAKPESLYQIAIDKGLSVAKATEVSFKYSQSKGYACAKDKSPEPNLRWFTHKVDEIIREESTAVQVCS